MEENRIVANDLTGTMKGVIEMAMQEIRIAVDSDYIKNLGGRVGIDKPSGIIKEALSLLDWASEEVRRGRFVVSTNSNGDDVHRPIIHALQFAAGQQVGRDKAK